jgi:very-short-patch-repair endonuclease
MRRILNTLHIDHLSEEPIPVETARGPITYIADFLIGSLIVEVDSALHDPDRDQERDAALRKASYDVLRFPDSQVAAAYDLIIQLEARIHGKPLEAPAR